MSTSKESLTPEVRFNEPNDVTYAAIEACQMEENMHGPFDNVAELMEALNS